MRLPFLLAALLLAACSSHADPKAGTGNQAAAPESALLPLIIRNARGAHRFDVEVALTPQDQAQGLMFRKSMAPDSGMLFPMDPPRTASFWMKNTLIPLDMLFIHTDGTIAFIKANAQPYSREPVSAGVPVAAVLELRGGRAAELDIREGDRISWGSCALPGEQPGEISAQPDFCPAS